MIYCVCPVCGTGFIYEKSFGWGYAYGASLVCSYHCMRIMRRDEMTDEAIKNRVRELRAEGRTAGEIADELGISAQAVGGLMRRGKKNRVTRPAPENIGAEEVRDEEPVEKPDEALRMLEEQTTRIRSGGTAGGDQILRLLEEWTRILKAVIREGNHEG
jgi:transcriptional regulator